MKVPVKLLGTVAPLWVVSTLFFGFVSPLQNNEPLFRFPYSQAGLSEQEAAAHMLSRFTYGVSPEQIDSVVSVGLENWFQQQLNASIPDDTVNKKLDGYEALQLSNKEIVNTYPRPGQLVRMAISDGVLNKDSIGKADKKDYRKKLTEYMRAKGLKPAQELTRQFINQKIIRAAYSNNQLQEVLTEFWFNHFNVSFSKGECAQFIPAYERDVIRPNALGNFEHLLVATAKSPAMLVYLDNFSSTGTNSRNVAKSQKEVRQDSGARKKANQFKRPRGLNENYAREVMELHTLGVEGGYGQADVTEAARVFTGWTIYPMRDDAEGKRLKKMLSAAEENLTKGIVRDGDFLFVPYRHDDGEKVVLGHHFAAGGGYEEGLRLLKILAHHKSTAHFISQKIAKRFVQDNPPESLVDKMAKTFHETDGDIKQVLITMVSSLEFWRESALREKTKSPFELAISAVRSLHAKVSQPYQLFNWVDRMGQKMYHYQAPTGFPDQGQYWMNTGSLLNRMNFGLLLATGRIPGVTFDLLALNNNHEPESSSDALEIYCKQIIPERDIAETVKRLVPLLDDPGLQEKVSKAASNSDMSQKPGPEAAEDSLILEETSPVVGKTTKTDQDYRLTTYKLSQIVGVILGSPEFQRR